MITLSNSHQFTYMVASGALGFGYNGWFWEWPFRWAGLMKPELFTVVIRTVTRYPRLYPKCNLSWIRPWTWLPWSPWSCVRFLKDGAVNKVGLYNPGIDWWCKKVAPRLEFDRVPLVGSIFGEREDLEVMASKFNRYNFVAIEVNPSCPNTGHGLQGIRDVVKSVTAVAAISRFPVILKVSAAQDYVEIAKQLIGVAEAISLNSVPYELVYPPNTCNRRSPLWKLEKKVGGGGGGVSGKPAQVHNWRAVQDLIHHVPELPVIGPSIMSYDDLRTLEIMGANAFSFGAIHLRTPWKPTAIVKQHMSRRWTDMLERRPTV